jgi:phage terminase small subunit
MDLRIVSKLNEQQERFCRLIVEGQSGNEAYAAAGYKVSNDATARANASRLLTNASICERIAELRKPMAAQTSVTLAWLIQQAQEVLVAAKADASHAASIAAIKELGILSGERIEQSIRTNRNIAVDEYSDEDLTAYLASNGSAGAIAEASRAKGSDPVH